MIRSLLCATLAAAALLAAPARAASIRYTYTGTVTGVDQSAYTGALPAVGETVGGTLLVTLPAHWDFYATDGATYQDGQANGLTDLFSGSAAFSGGVGLSQPADRPGFLEELVQRNYTGTGNKLAVTATGFEAGYDLALNLVVQDQLGAASTLFADPAGGVAFAQPVDLAGATATGSFAADAGLFTYRIDFALTSLTIAAVPEPAGAALLALGLVAVGAARRRGGVAGTPRAIA